MGRVKKIAKLPSDTTSDRCRFFSTMSPRMIPRMMGGMGKSNLTIDHTTASYSLLYDVEKRCWSSDCLQRMCLDDTRLPRLMDPWERLGELTPELCRTLGLDAPCPVAVGTVDGSCGILGAGGTTANVLISVMGTTDTCFLVSDKIIDDPTGSLVVNPHVIPGLYLAGWRSHGDVRRGSGVVAAPYHEPHRFYE